MISFLKKWCENIVVVIIICIIIEMILPEGKNKKYVQVVIGIYIVFSILNPLFSNLSLNNLNLNKIFETEEVSLASSKLNENEIEKVYIDAIKNDIKNKITSLGYNVKLVDLKINSNLEKIEKIIIYIDEKSNNYENKIFINEIIIGKNNKNNYISENEKEQIRLAITEIYEIEKSNIEIF